MKKTFVYSAALMLSMLLTAPVLSQELWIGDPAPPIVATDWLGGEPIDLEAVKGDKVVVLDFWATWCGPCIASMPHVTELQRKYADRGVIMVGVTKPDPNNSLEQVKEFVAGNTKTMGYRTAFDGDKKTFDAYMKAAGQTGIPTVFIVDRAGRIAWIGHPVNMDEPLADIVAGTHDIAKTKLVKSLERRAGNMRRAGKWDEAIRAYEALAALDPTDHAPWRSMAYVYALNLNWPGKTREAATRALYLGHDDASFLARFANFLASRDEGYRCADLALQAASRAVELAPNEAAANIALISALAAAGKRSEAMAQADKTLGLLADDARGLLQLAAVLNRPPIEDRALAIKAAARAVEINPDSPSEKITLIQMLVAAGKMDEATTAARKALALLRGDPRGLARLASILARPELGGQCGELALEAIDAALAAEPDQARYIQTKFRILALCTKDLKQAETLGRHAIEQAGTDAGFLNNFAWALLTEEGLKGNFNELALTAAEHCDELTDGTNWMYVDTLALAKFETGSKRAAFDLQTEAIDLAREKDVTGVSMENLKEALERYRKALAD